MGFAWIEPVRGARWILVRDGRAEVYATVGELPVRVTTTDVDQASSSARIQVSEYDTTGRLLNELDQTAFVAG